MTRTKLDLDLTGAQKSAVVKPAWLGKRALPEVKAEPSLPIAEAEQVWEEFQESLTEEEQRYLVDQFLAYLELMIAQGDPEEVDACLGDLVEGLTTQGLGIFRASDIVTALILTEPKKTQLPNWQRLSDYVQHEVSKAILGELSVKVIHLRKPEVAPEPEWQTVAEFDFRNPVTKAVDAYGVLREFSENPTLLSKERKYELTRIVARRESMPENLSAIEQRFYEAKRVYWEALDELPSPFETAFEVVEP